MSGIQKRAAVSMKTKLKALERLNKIKKKKSKSHIQNYGCRSRCGRAKSKRIRAGRNHEKSKRRLCSDCFTKISKFLLLFTES